MGDENVTKVPGYGLKVKLNHKYPEKRSQNFFPRFSQLYQLIPLAIR